MRLKSRYTSHNTFDKYFLIWFKRFDLLKLDESNITNPNTLNLLNQFLNIVLKDSYLSVLNNILLDGTTEASLKILKILLDLSKLCLKRKHANSHSEILRKSSSLSLIRANIDSDPQTVINASYVILYRFVPTILMKLLSVRQSSAAVTKSTSKVRNYIYSIVINISFLVDKKIVGIRSFGNKSIYSIYKSMPSGNAKNTLRNLIAHIYRLKKDDFKLSSNDIFKEIEKEDRPKKLLLMSKDSTQNFTPISSSFQPANLNIGTSIIKCIEFISKGLTTSVTIGKTKIIDKLLLKCNGKLLKSYGKEPKSFRDLYLNLLEIITDNKKDSYTNTQSINLNENDLIRLIITHGEIRRSIWGSALIRHMDKDETSKFEDYSNRILQVKKFRKKELDRVLHITTLLERMSLTLGSGRASWLAAAQNHTDSYILKS